MPPFLLLLQLLSFGVIFSQAIRVIPTEALDNSWLAMIPSESKVAKITDLLQAKKEQLIAEIINTRYYRFDPTSRIPNQLATTFVKGAFYKNRNLAEKLAFPFEQLVYVIHPFNGKKIETSEYYALKILEQMKNELRLIPDDIFRLYIPIKKYVL